MSPQGTGAVPFEIRQLTVGEILYDGLRLIARRFVVLVGIYAVVWVPYSLVTGIAAEMEAIAEVAVAGIGVLLAFVIQVAVTRAAADSYLGRDVSISSAYEDSGGVFLPYLGTSILAVILTVLLSLLLLLPGIYVSVLWLLICPIAVVERTYGTGALKRSSALIRGNWWRSFGVLYAVAGGGAIMGALSSALMPSGLSAVVESIVGAYVNVVIVILYFDLRCRHADFDLDSLARQIDTGSGDRVTR